jgi:uncharacterized membrane protein YdjX (TVP38/TMEM64 family)
MRLLARLWPLLAILAGLVLAYAAGWTDALSLHGAIGRWQALRALVAAHPLLAPAAYVLAYVAAAAVSLPEAGLLTVIGGMLFGTWLGAACAIAGATAGSVLLLLAIRHVTAGWQTARRGGLIERVRPGLARDGFSYLVALRLLPVVPFWVVNLAAALAGMRLAPFALGTLIGIIPGAVVFASIGAGLNRVLARGGHPDLGAVLRAPVLLPFAALAVLALLPVLWRRRRAAGGPGAVGER